MAGAPSSGLPIVPMLSLGVLTAGAAVGVDVVAVAVFVPVGVGRVDRGRSPGRARRAEPDDREVGEADLVAESLPDLIANRVKLLRCERPDRRASLAGEELPLAAANQRVQAGSMSEVNVARESVLLERFEVAVDRRDVELQSGCDVLGRCRTVRGEERLEDQSPGGREPQATGSQDVDCLGEVREGQPGGAGCLCHDLTSVAQNQARRRPRIPGTRRAPGPQ